MRYADAMQFMYEQLPMFQRIGHAAYKENLDNTIAIIRHLGNPEKKFKSVHIAGTNGKGSSSHMLASIFQSAGYKTGLYTSPHLKDFRERIQINGKLIPRRFVSQFIEEHQNFFKKLKPSFFEMTVGLAFEWFAYEKVDMAIIETGLGGRLDSTNVINPEACLITNISLDHMSLLGNTIELIAAEKAGIIKQETPVVISQSRGTEKEVFTKKARSCNSQIYFAEEFYHIQKSARVNEFFSFDVVRFNESNNPKIICPLGGDYQQKNIAGVLTTIEILRDIGWNIPEEKIYEGLKNVKAQTHLRGRWELLGENPLIVADTAHNIAGIQTVLTQINENEFNHLHMVVGFVQDKDISGMLEILPKNASYYFCAAKIPRAMPSLELKKLAGIYGLSGRHFRSVKSAINAAKKNASTGDFIYIGGSTFVVAEVL